MAIREDLVASAVNFLQDPSVASSSIEKRREFLTSKNLTREEIEAAFARASGDYSAPAVSQPNAYYPPQAYQGGPPPGYNYGYPPPGQWAQPPQEPPRRDWRDWFIMATVVGGASYGLYALTQRYIRPLIAPPTPPQLEQDKAAIDEQFNRAFALLDTLATDTEKLKEAEEARTKKLDAAIADIEDIVQEIKTANQKREDDSRRMEAEIRGMKDSLPRAIDSVREGSERQLKELSTELGSLKTLMGNRMGQASSTSFFQNSSAGSGANANTNTSTANRTVAAGVTPIATTSSSSDATTGGVKKNFTASQGGNPTPLSPYPPSVSNTYNASSQNTNSSSTSGQAPPPSATRPTFGSGAKASIPAWQMAAQNNAKETASAGTPTAPPQDGAEVVNILNS